MFRSIESNNVNEINIRSLYLLDKESSSVSTLQPTELFESDIFSAPRVRQSPLMREIYDRYVFNEFCSAWLSGSRYNVRLV